MGYRVATAGFEGPFDLLLRLVTQQKVDIGAVSIAQIADQYLHEVEAYGELDMEVASDFVLVASSLLELKALALVDPGCEREDPEDDEFDELTPETMRDVLVARLMAYRQFKNVAASLAARGRATMLLHPRTTGPDPEFLDIMPDYLEGVDLSRLAGLCSEMLGRRQKLLLESEHIVARRIPLEERVAQIDEVVRRRRRLTFDEVVGEDRGAQNVVVSFLSVLELGKRHTLTLSQEMPFGTIDIEAVEGAAPVCAGDIDNDSY